MPDSKVTKHPELHRFGVANPSPTQQHPVINITGLIAGLEAVPDTSPGQEPWPLAPGLVPQNAHRDLHWIRSQFPFLQIVPFPKIVTKVLTANVMQRLDLPSETVLVMFKGTGDFWLSWSGQAQVPAIPSGGDANSELPDVGVYNPTNQWFYSGGVKQLTVFASANCIVQALCLAYHAQERT